MSEQKYSKSPFYVIDEFISPQMCEKIIDDIEWTTPDTDKDGREVKTIRTSDKGDALIYSRLIDALPEIQAHYQVLYKGTDRVSFEWFPTGYQGEFVCENSQHVRGKWLRTKSNRDFTAILFLCDYQETIPFEQDFEVYGGKLEFVQHQFSFQPVRGTLIVFPSDAHFINVTSRILVGDAFQARIQIAAQNPYLYNPEDFPGNFTTWFKNRL